MRLLGRGNRRLGRQSILLSASAIVLVLFFLPQLIFATDKTWTGATNTTWGTNSNWTGGAPAAGDNAVFNSAFSNQPNLAGNASAGGIWMTGSVGQNVTISDSGFTLTLNGNTINGIANLGILIDNTNAFTLTISASIKVGNAQSWLNNSSNLFTVSGAVNINNKALTIDGSGDTTISGLISGAGGFTKAGTGTLTLSNTGDTYTGQLTVQAGTLKIDTINNASANGELGNNALSVILGSSGATGTLEYTGATASSTKKFTMATGGTGAFQVDTAGTTLTLSGVIDGAGALLKTGAGTVTLSGANTYTGKTSIQNGTLSVSSLNKVTGGSASSSLGAPTTVANGTIDIGSTTNSGTLLYTGSGETTDRVINLAGTTGGALIQNDGTGALTFSSNLTATGAGSKTLTLQGSNTGSNTISGIIVDNSGSNTTALIKAGTGTWVLSGANTYTGGTTLSGGTLQLSGSGTLGSTSGALTVNAGTLDLNGTNQSVGALSGSGGTILNNSTGTAKTLTVGTGGGTGSYAGVIANHTSGTGTLALTKTGSGTETLSGVNTYTGATTINAGTLNVSGSLASGSAVTVNNSGSTFEGTGTIFGSVSIASSGAILEAGTGSTGQTLTMRGAVTMGSGSIIALALGASGAHSTLAIGAGGSISFQSAQTFNIIDLGVIPGSTYTGLITGIGADPGTESSWTIANQSWAYTFSYDSANGGEIDLTVTALPEPSTWTVGVLALVAIAYNQRRRIGRLGGGRRLIVNKLMGKGNG